MGSSGDHPGGKKVPTENPVHFYFIFLLFFVFRLLLYLFEQTTTKKMWGNDEEEWNKKCPGWVLLIRGFFYFVISPFLEVGAARHAKMPLFLLTLFKI